MFKELTDKINYSQSEIEILKFWKEQKVFEKSVLSREGKPGFTFYEGPPTANGKPGIHHVMSRTLKDLICRYKTMRGYQVHRKAGWDTHGLPVEIEVEKALGFKHKDEIVKYGVAKFNEECRRSVWKYKTDWERMTDRMGYWVDMSDPYVTFENNYIESIWWALKQYFDKGMIYKGYKIQPYCPRCETPLSSHEVSLGYEDVKDPSVYVKMKVKGEENTYFLVWTTTPWTLISNVALAVHPNVDYVKVEHKGQKLIFAESRLNILDEEYSTLEKFKGYSLLGKKYEPLFESVLNREYLVGTILPLRFFKSPYPDFDLVACLDFKALDFGKPPYVRTVIDGKQVLISAEIAAGMENISSPDRYYSKWSDEKIFLTETTGNLKEKHFARSFHIVLADFVTTEDGSGIVHIAPAYGEDDLETSKKYLLPTIHPVNTRGEFNPEVTEYAGRDVWEAGKDILKSLDARGLLYRQANKTIGEILKAHQHSYPHCWRCKTKLLKYARDSWFIATTKYAKRMVELNKTINWYPPEVGEGRFGNWLEENKDWSLSRDRFWGTPLPIWVCEQCGKQKCVGSVAEYNEGRGVREPLDLHKPFVDEVTFACACGGTMKRTPELIDVWFDSGAMQFAQWHYPFENVERFSEQHPADYICEGIDQTRGWFYSLHSISTFLFDKPAYKNLIVNELILDKEGQKMSKSKGNTVDPFTILEKYGADTVRWYLVATSPPWRSTLFDEDGLVEVQRKFLGTLVNTYAFFTLYANIDKFAYAEQPISVKDRPEIDRWVISELNSLVKTYCEAMDGYDVTKAARAVSDFTIDQLSNWYVRRNRRRFWKNEKGSDKLAAYQTLYECLITVAKLSAPFSPFIAEELYRNLNGATRKEQTASVHLAMIPNADTSIIDADLELRMNKAQRIVSLVRAIRNKANIKVRQPLKRLILPITNDHDRTAIERMEHVILEEINVKKIEYVSDDSGIVHKSAKPNFKTLGPKHGKSVQPVAAAIKNFTVAQIKTLEQAGQVIINVPGADVVVMKEDVDILHEDIKGWLVETDNGLTVALDTELTEELLQEGFAREFVNRVQNIRKDSGFNVTDRIRIFAQGSQVLHKALQSQLSYITSETLAVEMVDALPVSTGKKPMFDINGEACTIIIERVPPKNGTSS